MVQETIYGDDFKKNEPASAPSTAQTNYGNDDSIKSEKQKEESARVKKAKEEEAIALSAAEAQRKAEEERQKQQQERLARENTERERKRQEEEELQRRPPTQNGYGTSTSIALKYDVRDAQFEALFTALACMNDTGAPSLPLLLPADGNILAFNGLFLRPETSLVCSLLPCCEAANQCVGSTCSTSRRAIPITVSATQFTQVLPALKLAAAVVKVIANTHMLALSHTHTHTHPHTLSNLL